MRHDKVEDLKRLEALFLPCTEASFLFSSITYRPFSEQDIFIYLPCWSVSGVRTFCE